jgi:glycosyltransferase involved in cell wall biosynthesis
VIKKNLSIIVPFYNPPLKIFKKSISYLQNLHPLEIILVDDCSNDSEVINFAKNSNCTYLKTPYQSGHDGLPFNLGVQRAQGEFVCKVDADDFLLELPTNMPYNIHLARMNRSANPQNISIEELILAPRSIHNGAIIKKELMSQIPFETDKAVFADVLTVLRALYRKEAFSVHPKINYIYNKVENSMQTSKSAHYHRLRNIQTVARFAQLENIHPQQSEYYLQLAMLNLRYGANSRKILQQQKVVNEILTCKKPNQIQRGKK